MVLKSHVFLFSKGKGVAASTDTEKKTDKEVGDAAASRDNEITSAPPEEVTSQNGNPEELVQVSSYKNVQTKMVSIDTVVRVNLSDPLHYVVMVLTRAIISLNCSMVQCSFRLRRPTLMKVLVL